MASPRKSARTPRKSARSRYSSEASSESSRSDGDSEDELIERPALGLEAVANQGLTNTLEFKTHHQTFWNNAKLSGLVAFWITLVSLPSFHVRMNSMTFGSPECQDKDLGTTYIVHFNNNNTPPRSVASDEIQTIRDRAQQDVLNNVANASEVSSVSTAWCGYLPKAYYSNWPNVVQMIVFTVYQNTGVTIKQAWQGTIGTWAAAFNHWLMCCIWPHGADNLFVWIDILGFYLVVLCSGSAENTMKFSMNWHSWFMMAFISSGPDYGRFPIFGLPRVSWDSYTTTSLLTSIVGVIIAVIATLFPPPPISNYGKVSSNAGMVAAAMRKIWNESIEYFCGRESSANAVVISEAITNFNLQTGQALSDLSASWWEGFDLCGRGRKRQLYMAFDTTALKMDAVMVAVKDSTLKESFQGSHVAFCEGMRECMDMVKDSAADLFEKCEKCCRDGEIDDDEVEELQGLIEEVANSQANMLRAYRMLSKHEEFAGAKFVSEDLASENTFIFALSVWARKIQDFAGNIIKINKDIEQSNSCHGTLVEALRSGFINTWAWPTRDKLDFALRNWVVIAGLFVFGYSFHCSKCVFTNRSANMAALMTLLINHYSGSAFLNNLKRLMGVTIGKVLPVICMTFMDPENSEGIFAFFDCSKPDGTMGLMVIIFIFAWFWNYMYYTSKEWGLIGCLAAAFGCSGLAPMCGTSKGGYYAKYQEIAQDVFAIFFGLAVDLVLDRLRGVSPRESAVSNIKAMQTYFEEGFGAFFDGNLQKMEDSLANAKDTLTTAQLYAREADPRLKLVPGWSTDFKVDLYNEVLQLFHLLHSDLAMLILALKVWVPDRPPKDGNDNSALQTAGLEHRGVTDAAFDPMVYMNQLHAVSDPGGLRDQLGVTLQKVLNSLYALLRHDMEGVPFQDTQTTHELVIMSQGGGRFRNHADLYREINCTPFKLGSTDQQITQDERVKVTVVCRALEKAKDHLNQIQILTSKYITL